MSAAVRLSIVDDEAALTIRVADRGPGVVDEERGRLLERGVSTKAGPRRCRPRARPRRGRRRRRHAVAIAGSTFTATIPKADMAQWRTLIVEDSPTVAEVHRRLVASVPGFVIAGIAGTAADARPPRRAARVRTCCCSTSASRTATGSSCCERCAARASRSR